MKGLLLKDWYTLIKQAKIFMVLILMFAILPGQFSAATFAVVYASMLPISALAYDERAKWDNLAAMMPYSIRDIVVSKYLLGYIAIAVAALLSAAAKFIADRIAHTPVEPEVYYSILLTVCLASVILALNLPVMFKQGVERGRIAFFILIAAVVIGGMLFGEKLTDALSSATADVAVFAAVCAGFAVLFNLASIWLSCVWYKRRAA